MTGLRRTRNRAGLCELPRHQCEAAIGLVITGVELTTSTSTVSRPNYKAYADALREDPPRATPPRSRAQLRRHSVRVRCCLRGLQGRWLLLRVAAGDDVAELT